MKGSGPEPLAPPKSGAVLRYVQCIYNKVEVSLLCTLFRVVSTHFEKLQPSLN